MAKKKTSKMWVYTPPKPAKPSAPDTRKQQVEAQCKAFIEQMKPHWIQPADGRWGYVSDVYGKWYRHYYHFCALYRYNAPEATEPEREIKFARLEYAGPDKFHLAYFRHTGQWWQVFDNLSLDDCLEQIKCNPIFQP